MVTATGHGPRRESRVDAMRAVLARRRRNLLLPILLLVAVALVAVSALLYWSAESINRGNALAQQDLVRSVVQIRRNSLRQLVIDYAWRHGELARLGQDGEGSESHDDLPVYLKSDSGIAAGWVIAPDGTVRFSFESGRTVPPQSAPVLPRGTAAQVAAARAAGTTDEVPATGFVLYRQDLAIAGASPMVSAGVEGAAAGQRSVLLLVQPLDLTSFARAGIGEHIENLHFLRGGVPPGYHGCEIAGLDGKVIGSVIWRDRRPGDALLWSAAPLLLIALLAVCFLCVLAIKRVETVVSREGRLSISLHQEKQRRSQKSDFVSMVSHELRTPLQAIGTAADMLERFGDQMNESERREETLTIRRAVSTLAGLVDDVLVMGRAEATAGGDGDEPVDLARLCRAVWREVSVALRATQKMTLRDGIGASVSGANAAALHAILSNLMQNAIKYSGGVGDIEFELSCEDGHCIIAVSDHGPGIPPGEREAIFQPYWRSKQTDDVAGTGLGLSVARSAARSLGGELWVEAPEQGNGARFVVRWPTPARSAPGPGGT